MKKRILSIMIITTGVALLIGVGLLTGKAQQDIRENDTPPLMVEVLKAKLESSYTIRHEFIGKVENRRQSDVGFELAGKLTALHFDDGDSVAKDALLAALDMELLDARKQELESTKKQMEAEVELARLTRNRMEQSAKRSAVTLQQYDEAQQAYLAKQAALQAVAARIRQIDVQLQKSKLYAPFPAIVQKRMHDEGEVIQAGEPVFHLVEDKRFEVRVGVNNDWLPKIQSQNKHQIRIQDDIYPAVVKSILPLQEDSTRTVDILFELQHSPPNIRQGNLAVLTLQKEIPTQGFWLPIQSLTDSSRGLWACYVVLEEGNQQIVKRQNVTLLHQQADEVFVSGSLQDGDLVVRNGLHRLVPNQAVRVE